MATEKGLKRTIVLTGERPASWQHYYKGEHWSKRQAEAQRVHALVRAALDPEDPPFDGPIHITTTVYFSGHPLDPDNIPDKLYIDGLKGWWIDDDTREFIHGVTTIAHEDKANPRVVVQAEQVGDPFDYECVCCGRRWPNKKRLRAHEKESAGSVE